MSIWDYFIAALRCPACGAVCAEGADTGMRTYIRGGDAYHVALRVGDDLDVAGEGIAEWECLVIRQPAPDEPLRLLEVWVCPSCAARSFAEVVVREGILESITAVALSRPLLDRVHGVSFRLEEVYPLITGVLIEGDRGERPDWLERLRAALPEDGSAWTTLNGGR